MHWHWQNLNEHREGGRTICGSPLKHGRAWFRRGENQCLRVEWVALFDRLLRFGFGPGLKFHLVVFGCGVYFALEGIRVPRWLRWLSTGECHIYTGDGGLWWAMWAREMEWRASDPWWRSTHSIMPVDIVLGPLQHRREVLTEKRRVLVPMLEGAYEADVELERRTWTRKRWPWWPFTRSCETWDFSFIEGIPHDGKGENSWDCGDDALCGTGVQADSLAEAIGRVAGIALRSRVRYGGEKYLTSPYQSEERKPIKVTA